MEQPEGLFERPEGVLVMTATSTFLHILKRSTSEVALYTTFGVFVHNATRPKVYVSKDQSAAVKVACL